VGELLFAQRLLSHQRNELFLAAHVTVKRHRRSVETRAQPSNRQRIEAFFVGERDGGGDHLLARELAYVRLRRRTFQWRRSSLSVGEA